MRAVLSRRLWTLGVPVAAHGLLLWGLAALAARAAPGQPSAAFVTLARGLHALGEAAVLAARDAQAAAPTLVELAAEAERLPPEWLSSPERERAPGDVTERAEVSMAPRRAEGDEARAPRPDHSATRPGRPAGEAHGTSHERAESRLDDGARRAAPARTRTASSPASPAPERRARLVGLDPTEGPGATGGPRAGPRPLLALGEAASEQEPGKGSARGRARSLPANEEAATGGAPLAEEGAPAFDADLRGAAADRIDRAGGSVTSAPAPLAAHRPGPSAPDQDAGGVGRERVPGADVRATAGDAAAAYGAPEPSPPGPAVQQDRDAEPRQRHLREIQRRAAEAVRFPTNLALALHQGEAIVRFVVARDGRVLAPVELLKSAGFAEFDEEARAAPLRAAPYPRMPDAVTVTLRLSFRNPLVR